MDKLVALPTGGDAFLLRRGNRNILIDGGYSSRRLATSLSRPDVAVTHLHIVVCTHADEDHAGGLTDLLDKQPIRVGEFWLPGAWSGSLPELLRSPELVVNKLVAEFDRLLPEMTQDGNLYEDHEFELQMYARITAERSKIQRDSSIPRLPKDLDQPAADAGLAWLKQQALDIDLDEANSATSAKAFNRGRRLIKYRILKRLLNPQWAVFWVELINTAERIRKIAVQALRYKVKVRWFDFGEFAITRQAYGGESDVLIPLNAVELAVPTPPLNGLSYWARLTPVNEECLVFFSPGKLLVKLGVIFTGDSPMGDGLGYAQNFLSTSSKPRPFVVVTAPHHGSEVNAVAYKHLAACANVVLWLRSGGSSKHPGSTFRALPPTSRACTNCPHLKFAREVVDVQLSDFASSPLSQFKVRARDCSC